MKGIVLFALLALASAASDFYLCEVVVPNFCYSDSVVPTRDGSCASEPSLNLNGRTVSLTDNYGVIAFGDFVGDTSDAEQRVAVKGSGMVEAGYSIGAEIYSKGPGAIDSQIPYSAIFGQSFSWPSGRLFPDGLDQFVAAYNEDLYVGGTFTAPDYLNERLTSNPRSAGAFDAEFDAAQNFYVAVQNALAAVSDNIQINVQYTTATITCPAGATAYSGTISAADLGTVTSYVFNGCAADIQMVINVPADGTDTVNIHSGSMNPSDRRPERTVFNIQGSGRTIDLASVEHHGVILSPLNNYRQNGGYTQAIVIVNNILTSHQFNRLRCVRPAVPDVPSPCVSFEQQCAGTLFSAPNAHFQGDTREYNVISFGSFVADTGDVEGRVMVRNDFTVGNGYSVGYEISTANNMPDRQQDYSLLVGGSCNWGSGSLHPDGTNAPYAGATETAFCGNGLYGAEDLKTRVSSTCAGFSGCLDSIFDAAKGCYDGYAANLASINDNVQHTIVDSAMTVTCSDSSATAYALTLTSAEMTQFTYYVTVGCNYQAYWTINIASGADNVVFSGDSFPAVPGAVVYNVQGCRTIQVRDTALNGHLLSTCSTLNQTGGVILGKVVVGDVLFSLQINKEDTCQTITEVTIPVQADPEVPLSDVPEGFSLCFTNDILVGDTLDLPIVGKRMIASDNEFDITAVFKRCATFDNDPSVYINYAPGTKVGTITRNSNAGAGSLPNEPNKSAASALSVSIALIAIIALLF